MAKTTSPSPNKGTGNKLVSKKPRFYFKRKKNPLETLPLTRLVSTTLIVAVLLLGFAALAIFLLPPEIPLFYFAADPKNQIADSWSIIVPPVLAIVFASGNFLLAIAIKSDYLKKVLIIASFAIVILVAIAVTKIFFLVASF